MNRLLKALLVIVTIFSNKIAQANTVTNLVIPVSYFINHVKQLHELEQNLDKYKAASIVGTSGIGKTQLIRMYAYENRNKYKVIWFIDCNFDIKQEFLKLARAINISVNQQVISEDLTKIEEEVISYLAKLDNWLLIFDNNKIKSDFKLKKFIELEHNGHIVFCSQDLKGLPHIIKIKEFSKKDAEALAESILANGTPEEINFIVEAFKGYPVLIVQGAQIVSNIRGLSKAKYKKMIQETDDKIKLNIELCKKELTQSANELLNKIALINNQSFSKDFLRMLTKHKETLDDDIYQLARFVLVSNTIYDEVNPLFEMHDVIAETIREINGEETNKKLTEEIISTVLAQSFPKGVARRHIVRTSPTVGENLQIILTNSEKFNIDILKNLELRLELFGTSTNNGDYNNAKLMVEWFEEKEKNQELDLNKMNNHEKYVYALYLDVIGCYKNYALSDPIRGDAGIRRISYAKTSCSSVT